VGESSNSREVTEPAAEPSRFATTPGTGFGSAVALSEVAALSLKRGANAKRTAAVLTLQRTAGNAAVGRLLQRQEQTATADQPARDPARDAELDQVRELVISTFYTAPEHTSTWVLLEQAKRLQEYFELQNAPRTRIASARALIAVARVLHEREEAADREQGHGALLREGDFGGAPQRWTKEGATALDEIAPFGQQSELAWTTAALAEQTIATTPRRGRREPPSPPPAVQDVPDLSNDELAAFATPAPAPVVGSTAAASPRTATERAAGAEVGGDAEVRGGLSALGTTTGAQATAAVSAGLGGVSGTGATSSRSLLDLAGEVWFVERRLYALDRTGHVLASDWDDFAFDLKRITLAPGAYFLGPFAVGSSGFKTNVLVKVAGAASELGRGEIYPARVNTSLIPLLERGRGSLRRSHGVAIIVSEKVRQPTPSFDSDRLIEAMSRAQSHIPWAIRMHLARIAENPGEEAAKVAIGLGVSRLSAAVPVVGQAMLAYQLLRLAAWMGEAADVAGRAQSMDEVDIAGQAVAHKVAGWAITEAITRVGRGAVRAGTAAVRRGSGGGGSGGPPGGGGGGTGGFGPRPRRIYPDFRPPLATEQALVAQQAGLLARQTGLPIRVNQILEAPWIGKNTPRSTSEGWLRDSGRFWSAYAQHAPNENALLGGGRVVTPQYAQAMSWPASTVGQPLVHHHINNSRFVIPLPANAHGPGVHRQATVVMTPADSTGPPEF
jgi:HNH/endonuclease VII toxin of polymorphic toxin system